jgi:hypothetical protein
VIDRVPPCIRVRILIVVVVFIILVIGCLELVGTISLIVVVVLLIIIDRVGSVRLNSVAARIVKRCQALSLFFCLGPLVERGKII